MQNTPRTINEIILSANEKIDLRAQLKGFWRETGKGLAIIIITLASSYILSANVNSNDIMIVWFVALLFIFSGLGLLIARNFYLRNQQLNSDLISLARNQVKTKETMSHELLATEMKLGNRLRSLEDRSVDAIVEIDLTPDNVRYIRVNKAFTDWFGYTSFQLNELKVLGKANAMLYDDESLNTINEIMRKRLEGNLDPVETRVWMIKKDGRRIPIRYRSAVVKMNGTYISQVFLSDLTIPEDMGEMIRVQRQLIDDLCLRFVDLDHERHEAEKLIKTMKSLSEDIKHDI